MSISGGPKTVASGLLCHFDFGNSKCYQTGSSLMQDLSGDLDATIQTDAQYSQLNAGSAIMDGANIFIPYTSSLGFIGNVDFSINSWVYPTNLTQTLAILDAGTVSGVSGIAGLWAFRIQPTGNGLNLVKYGVVDQIVSANIVTNRWYMLTAVKSSTQTTYYVNGTSIGQFLNSANISSFTTNNIRIGRERSDITFKGRMGMVSVYNRLLSTSEISELYNAHTSRFT